LCETTAGNEAHNPGLLIVVPSLRNKAREYDVEPGGRERPKKGRVEVKAQWFLLSRKPKPSAEGREKKIQERISWGWGVQRRVKKEWGGAQLEHVKKRGGNCLFLKSRGKGKVNQRRRTLKTLSKEVTSIFVNFQKFKIFPTKGKIRRKDGKEKRKSKGTKDWEGGGSSKKLNRGA